MVQGLGRSVEADLIGEGATPRDRALGLPVGERSLDVLDDEPRRLDQQDEAAARQHPAGSMPSGHRQVPDLLRPRVERRRQGRLGCDEATEPVAQTRARLVHRATASFGVRTGGLAAQAEGVRGAAHHQHG
jgi:hypothetical protein